MFGFRRGGKVIRSEALLRIELPAGPLQCRLRLSNRRRTLALRISAGGEVVVNAPQRLPLREIELFLQKHADWIDARLQAASNSAFVWQDAAVLPFRGETLSLSVQPFVTSVRRQADCLICGGPPEQLAQRVTHWYRREARAVLQERLVFHAQRVGLPVPPLRVSDARTRWGSLSAKGVVSLNWRLIKASPEQLDYVICHELAHFRQRNHSAAFWREVERLFPDYQRVRAKLRETGRHYFAF